MGQWTEARFISFIKSSLRSASRRWSPIHKTKKDANVSYGLYKCAGCGQIVPPTKKVKDKRTQNIFVDHIKPIIDPVKGFTTWDDFIENLFCEQDNLQLLCKDCHDAKSNYEKSLRKKGK